MHDGHALWDVPFGSTSVGSYHLKRERTGAGKGEEKAPKKAMTGLKGKAHKIRDKIRDKRCHRDLIERKQIS